MSGQPATARPPGIRHYARVTSIGSTNIRVQRRSRKRLQPGDVFAVQLLDGQYIFGRVIRTDATWGLSPDTATAILIYLYRQCSPDKALPERGAMQPRDLLVPPVMINRLAWSRGYFETIGHLDLEEGAVLTQHCFRRSNGQYFDDNGQQLSRAVEPVGIHGLHSFRTVDDLISDALGFARASD
jgi:hypothetical protein